MALRWNIQRKLNVVLTVCGLLFIAVVAPLISYVSFAEYKRDAATQQARLVGAVRTSAAIATFVANEEIATEVLNGLLQDDEILAVMLLGKDGFVMKAQSSDAENLDLSQNTTTNYPLFSPVNEELRVGDLNIWSHDELIAKRALRIVVNDIALLIALTFLLAIASMYVSNWLVGRPLRKLAEQVADAEPGKTESIEAGSLHQHDEIGLVTTNVNDFLAVTRNALDKERALREQIEKMNQHFSNIFATSNVGIMVLDDRGLLLHHNPVLFENIIKMDSAQEASLSQQDIFSIAFEDAEDMWNLVDIARTNQETVDADIQLQAAWHQPCWVHCILTVNRDENTGVEVIEIVLYDVTRRVEQAEAARQLAEQDPLTGLHNRRGCDNYLQQRLRRPEAKAQLVAMLLDLDGFKPVNDQYGHAAGDEVLQVIAQRLQGEVRANTDLVGRIGGDEFVVFLKMKVDNHEAIATIANKIIQRVAEPIPINMSESVNIGVSIGIAFASDYDSLDALMHAADEAMYQVKTKGKNDFAFA